MDVLYIAPYGDASGYGCAARNYIEALRHKGINVDLYPFKHDNTTEYNWEYEQSYNPNKTYDIRIVHSNPGLFNKGRSIGNAHLNVGLTTHETTIIPSDWVDPCNSMDLIVVPCRQNLEAFKNGGVTKPIEVSYHCFDMDTYDVRYPEIHDCFDEAESTSRRYNDANFYSIFEWSFKKGLDILIPAYYLAFKEESKNTTTLTLKISSGGTSKDKIVTELNDFIEQCKEKIPLPYYQTIYVIVDDLRQEQIYSLHDHLDVYVSTSRGEGWNIPAFEAAAFGNPVMITNWGGHSEFLPYVGQSYIINHQLVPPINMGPNYPMSSSWGEPLLESTISQFKIAMLEEIAGRGYGHSQLEIFDTTQSTLPSILEKCLENHADKKLETS